MKTLLSVGHHYQFCNRDRLYNLETLQPKWALTKNKNKHKMLSEPVIVENKSGGNYTNIKVKDKVQKW